MKNKTVLYYATIILRVISHEYMYLPIHDDQIGYKKSIYMQSILSVLKILNHIPAPTHLYKQKEKEKVFRHIHRCII